MSEVQNPNTNSTQQQQQQQQQSYSDSKINSPSIFLKQSNELIKAELNKDNATSAVTGFVNLLIVLLKLTNKIKINKEVTKGIKGIRIAEFMKFPTKIICI